MGVGLRMRGPLALAALMLCLSASPLVIAADVAWTGPDSLQSVGGAAPGPVTMTGFDIERNGTVLDAWLQVSADGRPNSTAATGWAADDPAGNFSHGTHDDTSDSLFDGELSLDTAASVGRVHDLEVLSHRFTDWTPGGAIGVWSVIDPTTLNGSVQTIQVPGFGGPQNITARTNGGGHAPRFAADGDLIAMTTPDAALPGGSSAWLTSPVWPVPAVVEALELEFDHWLHVDTDADQNGSGGGSWVEVSLDGGQTWSWVPPLGGYPNTISSAAPAPVGVPAGGGGFPVWASVNASGWQRSLVRLDGVAGISNATSFAVRLVIWTPQQSADRPGWFVDGLSIVNLGAPAGTWFHGDLTGEYGASANASLLLPVDLGNTSGPLILEYATDFDIEGDIYDNLHIEATVDGVNWTRVSPAGGIPHHGIYVNGTTYGDTSGGWISLQHVLPAALIGAANASLRFRVETDPTPGTGYGGTSIDPPEGIFIDDVRIVEGVGTARSTVREWNFTNASLNHSAHGVALDEWQHVTDIGHNGPWGTFTSFEDSPLMPDGWAVETVGGMGWQFGGLSAGVGPSAWSSGQNGAGVALEGRYAPDTWTHLISPSLPIPAGSRAILSFEHWICSEAGWDVGALFISSDGGHTWSHFGSNIPGWYDTVLWNNSQSPLFGMFGWDGSQRKNGCHNNRTMMPMRADMSQLAGSNVQLRFSFFSDELFEHDGWYIDDVGIRVDVFEPRGNWTSPVLPDDDPMGWQTIELDAAIPNGTWVRGSVLDSLGRPLADSGLASAAAWSDLTFPISLAGLAEEMRARAALGVSGMDGVRIELSMGSDEPQRTPRIRALMIGSTRLFDAHAPFGTGWTPAASPSDISFEVDAGNLSNPSMLTHGIVGQPLIVGRPFSALRIEVEGAGALIDFRDVNGTSMYSGTAISGLVSLPWSARGLTPQIDLQPGGWLRRLTIEAITTEPAIDARIDALADGSDEWVWPELTQFGPHGWQTQFALGAPGEPLIGLDGAATNRTVAANASHRTVIWNGTGPLSLSFLEPMSAAGLGSGTLLLRDLSINGSRTVSITPPVGSGPTVTIEPGTAVPLPYAAWMHSLEENDAENDGHRSWARSSLSLTTSSPGDIAITLLGHRYPITENLSGLGPAFEAWRNASLSSGGAPSTSTLPLPFTFEATNGGVAVAGTVVQRPAITDEVVATPTILLPDQPFEVVSRHAHLFDGDSLDAASLSLHASDGRVWGYSVDLATGPADFVTIDDPAGTGTHGGILLDANASSVTVIGDTIEVIWALRPDWTVDDAASLTVLVEAIDLDGGIWGPARAVIGAGGAQAIENDLEITAWTAVDEAGRDLLAAWDERHPFHVRPGASITMTGQVRFEGIQSAGAAPDLWAGAIELSDGESSWTTTIQQVQSDGAWSASITVPEALSTNAENLTLRPALIRVGPVDRSRIGAVDATQNGTQAVMRIDRNAPSVGPLLAQIGGGLRPIDGNTWSPDRPLVLSVHLTEAERFGPTLSLFEWHEAIDDIDGDGIADAHEYEERVRMVGSSGAETKEIDLGSIGLATSCCGQRISFYLEGADHSGRPLLGGGGPGLDSDLATLIIEADQPTTASRDSVSLDLADDGYLLLGVEHRLGFTLHDDNGVTSLDNVTIHLAGESSTSGTMFWDPLSNSLTSDHGSGVQPLGSSIVDEGGGIARIELRFVLDDLAPSDWRYSDQVPAIIVTEDGTRLDLPLDQIPDGAWRFDTRTAWVIDSAADLSAPYGRFHAGTLYLHDGDLVHLSAHLVHERTGSPLDHPPAGRAVEVDAGNGTALTIEVGQDGRLDFDVVVPSNGGIDGDSSITARIDNIAEVGWPALRLPLVLDRTSPVVHFLGTSLVSVNTDMLATQLVAFTMEETGGLGDNTIGFGWRFQRSGLELLGMSGSSTLGPAVDNGGLWDISERVDMRVDDLELLRDGDQIVVWVNGTDLAGNPIVGEGTASTPRAPHLRIIWFEPSIDTVLIAPQPAHFGTEATIDVRLRDLGNGGGEIELSLWAWEDDGSGLRWIELARTNVMLAPAGAAEAHLSVEMWREGDLALLLAIDGDIEGGRALPSLHVGPAVGSDGFLGGIIAGDAASIGLLILVFTGIGFMLGIVVLRRDEEGVDWDDLDALTDESLDESHDDESPIPDEYPVAEGMATAKSRQRAPERPRELWPDPPDSFPDESADETAESSTTEPFAPALEDNPPEEEE